MRFEREFGFSGRTVRGRRFRRKSRDPAVKLDRNRATRRMREAALLLTMVVATLRRARYTVVSRDRSFSEPTIEVERTIHASPLSGDNSATTSTREGCTHLYEYRRRLELTTYRVASPTPANGCQPLESLHSTCFLARISTFDDCSFGPYECKYLFILQVLQSFRLNE